MKILGRTVALDDESIERAHAAAGYKGYVTNIPASVMDGHAVVAACHDLWKVEQTFRMAESDLNARLILHRTRDAIDAHLTIVFAAPTIAHDVQNLTVMSIKKIVQTLHRIHTVTVGHPPTARTPLNNDAETTIATINAKH